MDIRPIFSTLRRHKTAAALIVIEIALACAIICNAIYLIDQRLDRMQAPSGVVENELLRIQLASPSTTTRDGGGKAVVQQDLGILRGIPGVVSAAAVNQLPFGNSSSNSGVRLQSEQQVSSMNAATYIGNETMLDTFGLRLVAGRNFNADEYQDMEVLETSGDTGVVPSVIITRNMAERLYPGENPIGKTLYSWGNGPTVVVGVVEGLMRPSQFGDGQYSMLMPIRFNQNGVNYIVRVDPARRDEVLKNAVDALKKADPTRVLINQDKLSDMRAKYFQQDRMMAWLLVTVCAALLVVTALGIIGLASFWVQQRTKQIGIRRALGATRGQILRYFQVENFLLATAGIALGMLMAYGINQLLMKHYELTRLPLHYLPIGAVLLWLLGQIAVFGPARRAAAVPPAVATRSV
jgi:putative ABC transport system permease protein